MAFMSTPLYTNLSKSEQDGGLPAWCHIAADTRTGTVPRAVAL
jgi:hypothetical protein